MKNKCFYSDRFNLEFLKLLGYRGSFIINSNV